MCVGREVVIMVLQIVEVDRGLKGKNDKLYWACLTMIQIKTPRKINMDCEWNCRDISMSLFHSILCLLLPSCFSFSKSFHFYFHLSSFLLTSSRLIFCSLHFLLHSFFRALPYSFPSLFRLRFLVQCMLTSCRLSSEILTATRTSRPVLCPLSSPGVWLRFGSEVTRGCIVCHGWLRQTDTCPIPQTPPLPYQHPPPNFQTV